MHVLFFVLFYYVIYLIFHSYRARACWKTLILLFCTDIRAIWFEFMSYQEIKYNTKNMVTTFSTRYYSETIINIKIYLKCSNLFLKYIFIYLMPMLPQFYCSKNNYNLVEFVVNVLFNIWLIRP